MRIAYLLEVDPYENSGIIKKVHDQVNFWREKGHEVLLILPWPKPKSEKNLRIEGTVLSSRLVQVLPDGYFKNYLNKTLCSGQLAKMLEKYEPNILYLRQNTWYPGLTSTLKKNTSVLELNTVDIFEVRYFQVLKKWIYNYGREKILKSVNGLIAVTPAIFKFYEKYDFLKKRVVSNGIDLKRIQKISKSDTINTVQLLFVGIKNTEWHGLDKILSLAKLLPNYSFNIVGPEKEKDSSYPENVRFYGWVDKIELEAIYRKCHFGLGSFSNYLVGKEVDSTLKVREYLAYGLPVILGHWDVDFIDSKFMLKATDENNQIIEIESIIQFIEKYKGYVVPNSELKVIASEEKEEQRLNFFSELQN